MSASPGLVRNFVAGSAGVGENRLVKFGAADGEVVNAAAVGDAIIGVCIQPGGATSGKRADVALTGIAYVVAGGTISRGALLTADSAGAAVAAAPSAGVNNRVAGVALASAVAGDIFHMLLEPGSVQG